MSLCIVHAAARFTPPTYHRNQSRPRPHYSRDLAFAKKDVKFGCWGRDSPTLKSQICRLGSHRNAVPIRECIDTKYNLMDMTQCETLRSRSIDRERWILDLALARWMIHSEVRNGKAGPLIYQNIFLHPMESMENESSEFLSSNLGLVFEVVITA
jgi:hypothetical protein